MADGSIGPILIGSVATGVTIVLPLVYWLRGTSRREGVVDTKLGGLEERLDVLKEDAADTTRQIRTDIKGVREDLQRLPCEPRGRQIGELTGKVDTILRTKNRGG